MPDYIVTDRRTLAGEAVDVEVRDGCIDRVVETGAGDPDDFDPDRRHDADGGLVTPPLVEPHLHLDATQTAGDPSWNDSGTLAEGIEVWGSYKTDLTAEGVLERAIRTVEWYAAHEVTRIRTHADATEPSLTTVEALLELKERVADLVDLQVVAFPQDGVFTDEANEDLLREAVEMGADLVGAILHAEHTARTASPA